MSLAPLWAAPSVTIVHAILAIVALIGGLGALALKKGTTGHIASGRIFAAAMLAAAITSLGITNLWSGHFGPIHLLSILTISTLPIAVYAARRGQTRRHARVMMLNFVGLLIAGVFAVASPGRVLNKAFAMTSHPPVLSAAAR